MVTLLTNLYEDRMSFAALTQQNERLARVLATQKVYEEDKTSRIHFCGMAYADNEEAAIFFPRRSDRKADIDLARLTMRVVAKYGRRNIGRKGIKREAGDNSDLVALVTALTEDFRHFGIYSERARERGRNAGKPDWARTISKELPYQTKTGGIIYANIRTTRSRDSHDNILSRIQAAVLRSILSRHGWWLEPMPNRVSELNQFAEPVLPRALWRTSLQGILPSLYDNRALSLARNLITWLDRTDGQTHGPKLFGMKDFSMVWELMLRNVLPNVELDWNEKLPITAYYKDAADPQPEMSSYVMTDIVVKTPNGLGIIDAKYYHAGPSGGLPGAPDIIKQIFYQRAMESITDDIIIDNAFVFPANQNSQKVWAGTRLFNRNGKASSEFPPIKVFYADIVAVMLAYLTGTKIDALKW